MTREGVRTQVWIQMKKEAEATTAASASFNEGDTSYFYCDCFSPGLRSSLSIFIRIPGATVSLIV